MGKQRNRFLFPLPARKPQKDGTNIPVNERRFSPAKPAKVRVLFNNSTATACGGYPLWDRFCSEIELDGKLASAIKICRGKNAFTAPEVSRFLIDAKVFGKARLMHVETLRLDPMVTTGYGIDGLPSNVTIGRYLRSFEDNHVDSFDRLNTRVLNQGFSRRFCNTHKKQRIIVDYDSSTFTAYGKQEGADRGRSFRKKDKPGFQPKFAFIGGSGLMLHQKLLPLSHNLSKDFLHFHNETEKRLPKRSKIWAVRGDGALYSLNNILFFEKNHYTYAISASINAPLRAAIARIPEGAWIEGWDERDRYYSVARIRYCPTTWDRERTFVISRRLRYLPQGKTLLFPGDEYKHFAYVTNYRGTPLEQFTFGVEPARWKASSRRGSSASTSTSCHAVR